jgi:hypothetical protein
MALRSPTPTSLELAVSLRIVLDDAYEEIEGAVALAGEVCPAAVGPLREALAGLAEASRRAAA